MIVAFPTPVGNWSRRWGRRVSRLLQWASRRPSLARPSLDELACRPTLLPIWVRDCPVAMHYLDLLADLPWRRFPERATDRAWRGPRPAPRAPFVAAYLVKLDRRLMYMSDLRAFLVEHPALVWVLGFPLVASPARSYGFDVAASVPGRKQLGRVLRELPDEAASFLLDAAVARLQQAVPEQPLGDTIALDTKHILAWVAENNPKAYVSNRYDPTRQPAGDPDCRLGCKRRFNTPPEYAQPASAGSHGEFHWGYASGVVAAVLDGVDVVLAERTRTFDHADITYFDPLMADVERRLGRRPRFGALDAAFDAFYIYDYFDQAGGFAAVPFVAKGGVTTRAFDGDGRPFCPAEIPMPLAGTFINRTSPVVHERGRYTCPLVGLADACPVSHKAWSKGGCTITMAAAPGARIRYQLDRDGDVFKAVYRQRTGCERINSQALDLGIERPRLRNQQAIAHLNTLTYVLIDLRAVRRLVEQRADNQQAA